jgi:hypothetical protein
MPAPAPVMPAPAPAMPAAAPAVPQPPPAVPVPPTVPVPPAVLVPPAGPPYPPAAVVVPPVGVMGQPATEPVSARVPVVPPGPPPVVARAKGRAGLVDPAGARRRPARPASHGRPGAGLAAGAAGAGAAHSAQPGHRGRRGATADAPAPAGPGPGHRRPDLRRTHRTAAGGGAARQEAGPDARPPAPPGSRARGAADDRAAAVGRRRRWRHGGPVASAGPGDRPADRGAELRRAPGTRHRAAGGRGLAVVVGQVRVQRQDAHAVQPVRRRVLVPGARHLELHRPPGGVRAPPTTSAGRPARRTRPAATSSCGSAPPRATATSRWRCARRRTPGVGSGPGLAGT